MVWPTSWYTIIDSQPLVLGNHNPEISGQEQQFSKSRWIQNPWQLATKTDEHQQQRQSLSLWITRSNSSCHMISGSWLFRSGAISMITILKCLLINFTHSLHRDVAQMIIPKYTISILCSLAKYISFEAAVNWSNKDPIMCQLHHKRTHSLSIYTI